MRFSLNTLTWECLRLLCQPLLHLLRNWTRPDIKSLTPSVAADVTRSRLDLILENAFLRQQMIILSRQPKRPALSWHDSILQIANGTDNTEGILRERARLEEKLRRLTRSYHEVEITAGTCHTTRWLSSRCPR